MNKVCSKTATWIVVLMSIVPGSVLHAEDPPSSQDQTGRNDQPASNAPIPPALRQALASSLSEATSIGAKTIPTPPTGTWGIVSEGDGGGGIFRDSDSEAEAWLGSDRYGVLGFGESAGAFFRSTIHSGQGYIGYGENGVVAQGNTAGGHFEDSDSSGDAYVGYGDYGIDARGTVMGGHFEDSDSSGYANVGHQDYGIAAYGNEMGGFFKDDDASGTTYAGRGDRGIHAFGTEMGGYFQDSNSTGYAYVGYGNRGIWAEGSEVGGIFTDAYGSGSAYLGYDRPSGTDLGGELNHGEYGVYAGGDKAGGYFETSINDAYSYIANNGYGINSYGTQGGGYFEDTTSSGYGFFAKADSGVVAWGNEKGGYFGDTNSAGFAYVGYSSYKITGGGSVSFVQNHPYDPSSVIVYAAPEGDEVATYTRGTAKLADGEATVTLGETFKWVTNPDLGLTVHLTPIGDPCVLYVIDQTTDQITVHGEGGYDCTFHYLVYGLRIGFEESSVVQEKVMESYIPSMADHRKLYERRPDLKSYNSLERFKGMHHAIDPKAKLDLGRAQALRDAIIEFDPAVHELPMPPGHEERPGDDLALEGSQRGEVQRVRAARVDHDRKPATDQSDLRAAIPVDADGNIYAPSFRPPSREVATLVDVSESVEPGDVLVIDRDTAGLMRRGFEGHDSGVVGVVLGSQSPARSGDEVEAETALHAEVAIAGVVTCNVDATYGAIWPGNLLVTSPTSGHAMRTESPLPGTIVGKALEPLEEGTGTIKVLVMLR